MISSSTSFLHQNYPASDWMALSLSWAATPAFHAPFQQANQEAASAAALRISADEEKREADKKQRTGS
ncbi:hypothetical protein F3Y22_tig00111166pilonHSYRG00064 [Hibiscus syriacus]|uniref:Uncharacterized protein n=1 Tax=Hibiscus syriacus TaxID=106335 RepID=A0A6A2YXT2_HIBSY|nr:hypothetical protein F3Y22_tig00111166pilonHSYRG00064 [Hibiscus syriacus]